MCLRINNITLGEGKPKICIPIVACNKNELDAQINLILNSEYISRIDFVEFRADIYGNIIKDMLDVLKIIKSKLNINIIFTYRTAYEGGDKTIENELSLEQIKHIYNDALKSGLIDILDVEMNIGDNIVKEVVKNAHNNNINIIMSNHDFKKTASIDEIELRLTRMSELGADILKLAAMPNSTDDLIAMLNATYNSKKKLDKPIVTMSMGKIGAPSRFLGGIFGSDMTFGAIKKISAPGQIKIDELVELIDNIDKAI